MSTSDTVEIIKIILPGLFALTSLLIVVITFLLEKYIPLRPLTEGRSYRNLIWCMTIVLILSGIGATFSLLILLGLKLLLSDFLLIISIICILILVAGIVVIVIKETFKNG